MTDADLIDKLGGPTAVARLLDFTGAGAVARVCNWRTRGIPAQVKVDYPHLFMPQLKAVSRAKSKRASDSVRPKKVRVGTGGKAVRG